MDIKIDPQLWKDLFDYAVKTATIVTSVIAAYFLIKDRSTKVKLRIEPGVAKSNIIFDSGGGFEYKPGNGIKVVLINKSRRIVSIDKVVVRVNNASLNIDPMLISDDPTPSPISNNGYKGVDCEQKRIYFFSWKEILSKREQYKFKQTIKIQALLFLENEKSYKSNVLYINSKDIISDA